MPTLNWVGRNSEQDLINADEQIFKDVRLLEVNHNPIIDKYEFDEKSTLELPNTTLAYKKSYENRCNYLFWGDNIKAMKYLLRDYSNKITLIYIDPPFATGSNFMHKILIGEQSASETSEAYSDSWGGGIEEYITFIYKRLRIMKELLSDKGSIYVHLDWHISHYIKVIMDEIFGKENFRNEIIWAYPAASVKTRRFFIRSFDAILFYTKSEDYLFNDDPNIYMEYSDRVKKNLKKDEQGLFYYRGGSHGGKKLSQKVYLQEEGIFPRDVWTDIPYVRANMNEYQGFSTQKPERLLKRIILASSAPGDLVADFFCGTGTTLCVAEKLNRRWIGSDEMKQSIDITRKRILNIYSSNNLYSWKKKYKNLPKSFKLFGIGIKKVKLPFLVNFPQDLKDNQTKTNNSNLIFTVSIKNENKLIEIELTNYFMPENEIVDKKLKVKINKYSDWIDSWAVDYNYNGNYFYTSWISFRTLNKRKLQLKSKPNLYEYEGEYVVAVKVINILGGERIQLYTVNIN